MTFPDLGSAIYATLAAGTALIGELGGTRIYEALAPQGQALPYVVYFRAGGGDDNSSPRRTRSEQWVVKGIGTAMGAAQWRHRPRRYSHVTSGIFKYHGMAYRQCGQ